MSIENGKDYRNWLVGDPNLYARNKEKKRILRFKIRVFERELKQEQKKYDKLLAGTENRKEVWHPIYDNREDLDSAYVAGIVKDEDYPRERYAIWQVYSDRGHINNIKWLTGELEKYKSQLEGFEDFLNGIRKEKRRKIDRRRQVRRRYNNRRRSLRRQKRKAELQERWKKYGIG